MTGFIMSKSSQQPPARKPDPLFQYPERYSQSGDDDPDYDKLLKLGVHEDSIDEMTPEQRKARLASGRVESDSGLEKPVMSRKPLRGRAKPTRYDEASQTEPTTTGDKVTTPEWVKSIPPPKPLNPPIEQSLNVVLPPRKKKPPERDDTRDFLKDMRAWDRKNRRAPIDPPPKRL
jgi:hypothetical protein